MSNIAISASSRLGADTGARVASRGGNAVDAAIAATIVGMISEPGIVAPGAGCFVCVWPADEAPTLIDAYAAVPSSGPSNGLYGRPVEMTYGGGMTTRVGPGSVAVPGAWDGLGEASARHGELNWADLVEPAIEIAAEGFPLPGVSEMYLAHSLEPIFGQDPAIASLLGSDGAPYPEGTTVRIPGLDGALAVIAEEGPRSWYEGEIAERLVSLMAGGNGWLTADDLAGYRAEIRTPTMVEVGEWTVATNPPPSLGGPVLAAMLMLLEAEGFEGWNDDGIDTMVAVQRAVLGYRQRHLDDTDDRFLAVSALLEVAQLGERRALLESPSTIHVSAVDDTGLACSVTTSAGYGAGVAVPGTGLMLNNCLGEVELQPKGLGSLAPGERLASNMAPSIGRDRDGGVVALGSPGASRITTALAQVIASAALVGMDIEEAVLHPRLHVEMFEGRPTVAYEDRIEVRVPDDMTPRPFEGLSMYFGGVAAAQLDPGGMLHAVADPRRTGAPAVTG